MSHGKSHTRFHRFLAKKRRQLLRQFLDFETPKDVLLHKFKEQKQSIMGT
jgi:hypothetical protein